MLCNDLLLMELNNIFIPISIYDNTLSLRIYNFAPPPPVVRKLIIYWHLLKLNALISVLTGDGNFAIVKQCQLRNTPNDYAMKIIDKKKLKGKEHMVENEIEIMKLCNHPNICKLIEEFETKDEIYLIMELVKVNKDINDRKCFTFFCLFLFFLHTFGTRGILLEYEVTFWFTLE